jgi:hypothetical protein
MDTNRMSDSKIPVMVQTDDRLIDVGGVGGAY